MVTPNRTLRIGVDCGGTNTDAVLVDLTTGASEVVLAKFKTPTTPEVTHGIQTAITTVLEAVPSIKKINVQAVSVGTTHFVNALVQRSAAQLERVAVIRLCGAFSRRAPPFASFSYELRELLEGPHFLVQGGLQIDGSEISQVSEEEIIQACEEIKRQDIRTVAISGIFAPIDFDIHQEEKVAAIVEQHVPGVFTTISKRVANIGMQERENATILNASLLPFARVTVEGFRVAAQTLALTCPIFVTSNDGTLLTLEQAAELPIRTFASGPTNSMRGASFLAAMSDSGAKKETALVVDVGGTTTEVGVLLPSGFPRPSASHHQLCGVMLNFAMPHVSSIGLGGGSLIRSTDEKVTVGPDSVGYRLTEEAQVFGGQTLTATDVAVAAAMADVGNGAPQVDDRVVHGALERIRALLEITIDSMKTSPKAIPVYLVGGGAILVPKALKGVSKVYRFPHFECANAVGAAIAQVSGAVDSIETVEQNMTSQLVKKIQDRARSLAIQNGAIPSTVQIIESEAIPIAYTAGRCRFYVKAAGEWGGSEAGKFNLEEPSSEPVRLRTNERRSFGKSDVEWTPAFISGYRPRVIKGVWYLSEIDLEFLNIGTYIMGCGGGGDPLYGFLATREMVRRGEDIKVIELQSLDPDAQIGWGGGMGSPDVSLERLGSEEYNQSTVELMRYMHLEKLDGLAALEIGGSNGMINLIAGSSKVLNIPIVDGDFMGRAYPTAWQTTPNVYDSGDRAEDMLPCALCSGDGTTLIMTTTRHHKIVDSALRAACVDMGTHVGTSFRPQSVESCERSLIKNTISLGWRLGRAVRLANLQGRVGDVGNILVDALGGPSRGKVLFSGKIIEVTRKVYKGHTVGEVILAPLASAEMGDPEEGEEGYSGIARIPFKNENLFVEIEQDGEKRVIASVPDLICILDSGNGRNLGTAEYKYGQRVLVLGVTAAPQWTDTERGLQMGDLRAFGYDDIPNVPLGKYVEPNSVIQQYNVD